MAEDRLRVTTRDKKYTVIQAADGGLRALRYGEEWRDLTGDGMVLALAQDLDELRTGVEAEIEQLRQLARRMSSLEPADLNGVAAELRALLIGER